MSILTPPTLCCQLQEQQEPARGRAGLLFKHLSIKQRSIPLTLEPYTLAMLPMAHLIHRIDPFDRYCRGDCALEEPYRAVVNAGARAYPQHTYLDLVEQYFGSHTRRLV